MRALSIWAAGYSRAIAARASEGDQEQLSKIGGVVLFAAIWTGMSWATASTTFLSHADAYARIGLALCAASAGAGFVLTFDRTMVHLLDTKLSRTGAGLWLLFRIFVILALGSFTGERVVPLFLHAELQQQALAEREASDARRQVALEARFETSELMRRQEEAVALTGNLETKLRTIPQPIAAMFANVSACRQAAQQEANRLKASGRVGAASRRLAQRRAGCRALNREAQAALGVHRRETREQLREARQQAAEAGAAQTKAARAVEERVEEARIIEADALTAASSIILWKLILTQPAATLKAALFMSVMLLVELLPFILKAFAGHTQLGVRLAVERTSAILESKAHLAAKENEARIAVEASGAVTAAMTGALRTVETQEFMRAFAEDQARALAPFEVAVRTLRIAENQKRELDSIAARAPDLAPIAHSLWTNAIKEAGEAI